MKGILQTVEWTPETISILFIDAFKYRAAAMAGVEKFFPYLQQNSLVIDQDFGWAPETYASMHVIMWYARQHFEFLGRVSEWMCIWRVVQPFSHEQTREVLSILGGLTSTFGDLAAPYKYW